MTAYWISSSLYCVSLLPCSDVNRVVQVCAPCSYLVILWQNRWGDVKDTARGNAVCLDLWFSPACVCVCAQSCPTLCNPIELASPGSSVHGISRARTLEWVAISFSRRSSQPRDRTLIFCVSCIGRWILYHYHHLGSLRHSINCLYLVLLICPFSFFLPIGYFWVSPVLFFDSAAFLFRFQNNKSYSIILFLHLSFPPPIPCL